MMLLIQAVVRRVFFWGVIAASVIFAITGQPDRYTDAAAAYRRGDIASAETIWLKLARGGDPDAQYNLGALYARGEGSGASDEAAHRWFLLAADSGNAAAAYEVGRNFARGRGVPQSTSSAVGWIRQAAVKGYGPAQIDMGLRFMSGDGVDQDAARARTWFARVTDPERDPQILYSSVSMDRAFDIACGG
jgi:TPR repeat protein